MGNKEDLNRGMRDGPIMASFNKAMIEAGYEKNLESYLKKVVEIKDRALAKMLEHQQELHALRSKYASLEEEDDVKRALLLLEESTPTRALLNKLQSEVEEKEAKIERLEARLVIAIEAIKFYCNEDNIALSSDGEAFEELNLEHGYWDEYGTRACEFLKLNKGDNNA